MIVGAARGPSSANALEEFNKALIDRDYRDFSGNQRRVANHCKFHSWQDAGISHPSRDRAADDGRTQVEPLWAPRRNHDPDCLLAWSVRLKLRVVPSGAWVCSDFILLERIMLSACLCSA
jgi:hypothetical protein